MDLGQCVAAALGAAELAARVAELAEAARRRRRPAPPAGGDCRHNGRRSEVGAMSARSLKVVIEVFPGRTSQTMKVRASGKRGALLLGKIRRVAYRQTLISASTEQLYVHEVLTAADALILS